MAIFSPHDRLFHFTFRNPRHVAGWLRRLLPPDVVAAVDWDTLTLANERAVALGLRVHVADLVFTARLVGSDEVVLVILEHKAHHDPVLNSQVLRYAVHLRRLAKRAGRPEPLVIPVVLHHGDTPFRPGDEALAAVPAALAAWQPRITFVVDDLFGRSEADLRRPGLTALAQLTHLALAGVRQFAEAEVLTAIDRWGDLLRAIEDDEGPLVGQEAIQAFGRYLLESTNVSPEDLQMAFSKNLNQPQSSIMTTAQRLRLEGHSQGLQQGLTQGLTQGQSHTLLRLLGKRFGPLPADVTRRVQAATQVDLDRWTDRVLDARTVAEVLAD